MRENKKVLVIHPGTPYAYQTALAVQEAGLLEEFLTCLYFQRHNQLVRLIALFARVQVENKCLAGIDDAKVSSSILRDIIYFPASRLPLVNRYSRPILLWRNQALCKQAARRLERHKFEAVVCHDCNAYHVFKKAMDLGVTKILVYGHILDIESKRILDEEAQLHPDFADSLHGDNDEFMEHRVEEAHMADHIIVGCSFSKGALLKHGIKKQIYINPYGCDIKRFSPRRSKKPDKKFRILFVGGVGQRKGIKYLLEAFKRLKLKDAELIVVGKIIGSGKGLLPYKGIFQHYQSVSNEELPEFYRNADVFVLPSVVEGFGIVLVEAMASGLPVITTPNTGGPDVIREGIDGFIVPIRNVEALMEKIELLYKRPDLRETMGQNARIRVKDFTWQAYRKNLGKLIHQFLGGNYE